MRSYPRHFLYPLLILLASLICASPAAAASGFLFGVSGNQPVVSGNQPDQPTLRALEGTPVGLFRTEAPWASVQPTAQTWDWTSTDATVTELAQAGLQWLPIAAYNTPWDETIPQDEFSAPASDSAFAAFAAAIAARYGPGGTFWSANRDVPYLPVKAVEIWNEENNSTYWTQESGATPGQYMDLYLAARAAIHRQARGVAAVLGGLLDAVPDALAFVRGMAAERRGSLKQVDAVGYHPYLYNYGQIRERIVALRQLLAASGAPTVPIDVTEVGFNEVFGSIGSWGSLLSELAQQLPRSACGVSMLVPYVWSSPGPTVDASQDGWYSLATADGQLTPAGADYVRATVAHTSKPDGWCAEPTLGRAATTERPAHRHDW